MSIRESFEVLKRDVSKVPNELFTRQQMEDELRKTSSALKEAPILSFIEDETLKIRGEFHYLWRLYAPVGDADGVGWILDQDIQDCMMCAVPFSFFQHKHHCRSCGSIICSSCSPFEVEIEEFKVLGPQRVCKLCFWGQSPVYCARYQVTGKEASEYTRPSEVSRASIPQKPKKSAMSKLFADVSNDSNESEFDAEMNIRRERQEKERLEKLQQERERQQAAAEFIQAEAKRNSLSSPSSGAPADTASHTSNPSQSPVRSSISKAEEDEKALRKQQMEEAKRQRIEQFERQQREEQLELQQQQAKLAMLQRVEEENGLSAPSVEGGLEVAPKAGFVIKTFRTELETKVFINICGHDSIPLTTADQIRSFNNRVASVVTKSLHGFVTYPKYSLEDGSVGFDIIVNTAVLAECMVHDADENRGLTPDSMKLLICEAAIRLISQVYSELLDGNYKLPKIRSGYKGVTGVPPVRKLPPLGNSTVDVNTSNVAVSRTNSTAAPSFTPSPSPTVAASSSTANTTANKTAAGAVTRDGRTASSEVAVPPTARSSNDAAASSSRSKSQDEALYGPYMKFIQPGERILAFGEVTKPNHIGFPHKRQLILTSKNRLFYCDPAKMEVKGEITWTPETVPHVYAVSD